MVVYLVINRERHSCLKYVVPQDPQHDDQQRKETLWLYVYAPPLLPNHVLISLLLISDHFLPPVLEVCTLPWFWLVHVTFPFHFAFHQHWDFDHPYSQVGTLKLKRHRLSPLTTFTPRSYCAQIIIIPPSTSKEITFYLPLFSCASIGHLGLFS